MPKKKRSPQEKKKFSLKKDRRNTYGENAKSSRKNIARNKALTHQNVRTKARDDLHKLAQADEAKADVLESTLHTARLQKGKWRKSPDTPLGEAIKYHKAWREQRVNRRKPKTDGAT